MPQDQDDALPGNSRHMPGLFWRAVGADLHVSLPKACREKVLWLREKSTVHPILFWLHEPHRVVAIDGEKHLSRVKAVLEGNDVDLRERVLGAAFKGKFVNKSEIVVPEPALAFVNGRPDHPGVWLWAARNRLELWGDAYQLAWLKQRHIRRKLPRDW